MSSNKNELHQAIQTMADQCVKCGLCLPYCPTYRLTEDENESPRGRIALTQALVGELGPTKKLSQHLENCLSCRHCERVCPAHVEYGKLITTTRQAISQAPTSPVKHSLKTRLLSKIVTSRSLLSLVGKSLWAIDRTGLRLLARYTGLSFILGLSPLDKLLPKVPRQSAFAPHYKSTQSRQGQVGLFLGCLSQWCDKKTTQSSIYVLNQLGFDVHIPRKQGCCGAMAMHQGDLNQGQKLLSNNADAFAEPIDALITTASGCGSMLKEANIYFNDDKYHHLAELVTDISHFVAPKLGQLTLKQLNLKVAVHTPCTLKNCMQESDDPIKLLQAIPGITISTLPSNDSCCGSAGSYMLENPMWAKALVHKLLDAVDPEVDMIATSNIGCALHLQAALREKHLKIEVVHPIVLLAMALGMNKFS